MNTDFSWRARWTAPIQVRVNGTIVNEVSQVFPSAGKILLQCEGSEIFFQTMRVFGGCRFCPTTEVGKKTERLTLALGRAVC
jgi:hypothetical protein